MRSPGRAGATPGIGGERGGAPAGHPSQPESNGHEHTRPRPRPGEASSGLLGAARAANRPAARPPGPAAPSVPPTCLLRGPAERRLRTLGRRGEAQTRAPALPQGSRGRCGASSGRAAATRRRLPRRARRNRAPRGSARARSAAAPGCVQASALGPAHAPALARLPLAAPAPRSRGLRRLHLLSLSGLQGGPGSRSAQVGDLSSAAQPGSKRKLGWPGW